jgi:hypothetical protein
MTRTEVQRIFVRNTGIKLTEFEIVPGKESGACLSILPLPVSSSSRK